jgi:hypothetical protein
MVAYLILFHVDGGSVLVADESIWLSKMEVCGYGWWRFAD